MNIAPEEKKLRAKKLTYKKIAKKLHLAPTTVGYWLNPDTRTKTNEISKNAYKILTPKQKKEYNYKSSEYGKQYLSERYNNDEEFRIRMIGYVQKSFNKRCEEWKKNGLCLTCGRKKKDKKFKSCEKCREKGRTRGLNNIERR